MRNILILQWCVLFRQKELSRISWDKNVSNRKFIVVGVLLSFYRAKLILSPMISLKIFRFYSTAVSRGRSQRGLMMNFRPDYFAKFRYYSACHFAIFRYARRQIEQYTPCGTIDNINRHLLGRTFLLCPRSMVRRKRGFCETWQSLT